MDQNGKIVNNPVFPWSLRFEPSGMFDFEPDVSEGDGYRDFRADLATQVQPGSYLFEVYAMDKPKELGGVETMIGLIITKSGFTTSNWADEHMFFRHERLENDLQVQKLWEPYAPSYEPFPQYTAANGEDSVQMADSAAGFKCPFASYFRDYL